MREYGSVQTQFWSDLALQSLSTHAKLLAVYLLTGPHTNMLGCFRLPIGYVAEDLKWDEETVHSAFSELEQIEFLIRDTKSSWVLITHFLDGNPIIPIKEKVYANFSIVFHHNQRFSNPY